MAVGERTRAREVSPPANVQAVRETLEPKEVGKCLKAGGSRHVSKNGNCAPFTTQESGSQE